MAVCWYTRPRFAGHEAMKSNTTTEEKRTAVEQMNFGAKTAKRVGWESYEFTVVGPHQVKVTNASWGHEKADHSYVVGIEERDGVAVPAECGCKADQYREDYDCKHKVALASVGGPVVLQAAVEYAIPTVDDDETTTQTLENKLRADGGAAAKRTAEESPPLDEAKHGECDCDDLRDDFPCWPCVRTGRRELPE